MPRRLETMLGRLTTARKLMIATTTKSSMSVKPRDAAGRAAPAPPQRVVQNACAQAQRLLAVTGEVTFILGEIPNGKRGEKVGGMSVLWSTRKRDRALKPI